MYHSVSTQLALLDFPWISGFSSNVPSCVLPTGTLAAWRQVNPLPESMATQRQTQGSPWLCSLQVQLRKGATTVEYACSRHASIVLATSMTKQTTHLHAQLASSQHVRTFAHVFTCRNVTLRCVCVCAWVRNESMTHWHALTLVFSCTSCFLHLHVGVSGFNTGMHNNSTAGVPMAPWARKCLDCATTRYSTQFSKCRRLSQSMCQTFAKERSPLSRGKFHISHLTKRYKL